jgi:hypothetical protein
MMQLRRNITVAKELLSQELSAEVAVVLHSELTTVRLTRRELEQVAEPLIARTLDVFEKALVYASISASDLHSILLVGAASRMPRVGEALTERFHVPLALDSHPKFAVCLGAAISSDAVDSAGRPVAAAGPWAPPRAEDGAGTDTGRALPPPSGVGSARPGTGRRRWLLAGAAAVVVVLLAVLGFLFFRSGGGSAAPISVAVPATQPYTDTGVDVAPGETVKLGATGTIHHNPAADAVGPDGATDPALRQFNVQANGKPLDANHAALIAKIGDGPPFLVGSHKTFTADRAGRLFLGVNDAGVTNNSGSYEAQITVSK